MLRISEGWSRDKSCDGHRSGRRPVPRHGRHIPRCCYQPGLWHKAGHETRAVTATDRGEGRCRGTVDTFVVAVISVTNTPRLWHVRPYLVCQLTQLYLISDSRCYGFQKAGHETRPVTASDRGEGQCRGTVDTFLGAVTSYSHSRTQACEMIKTGHETRPVTASDRGEGRCRGTIDTFLGAVISYSHSRTEACEMISCADNSTRNIMSIPRDNLGQRCSNRSSTGGAIARVLTRARDATIDTIVTATISTDH
ncbi:hypothetical protein J6590_007549 [Homalodisca vitripennis]|nr:hypothetical protein J6590_007549 [Homalodisca vitripennis]